MKIKKNLLGIVLLALFVRIFPLNFPNFTFEEARIASRGYALSHTGYDELGRRFPFIFNSLSDYQLPLTSYITAIGTLFFGKTDFGARIPFVLMGILIVFIIYKVAKVVDEKENYALTITFLAALCPPLIFLSRVPNDFIVLTFLNLLLFYLLLRTRINLSHCLLTVILIFFTSKFAWFTTFPFVFFTLHFFNKKVAHKLRWTIYIITLFLSIFSIFIFLQIPQSTRSFLENNFSIFQSITLKNGIEHLRGQGIVVGLPLFLDKLLFNKLYMLIIGTFHWFSHLQLSILFGQFDPTGGLNFMSLGVFTKVLIVPFFIGIIFLIRSLGVKKLLLLYPFLLSFPLFFTYPVYNLGYIVIIVPFLIFIIGLGVMNLKSSLKKLALFLVVLEILINLLYFKIDVKNADLIRPTWIKHLITDNFELSAQNKNIISDNIVGDIMPFIQWNIDLNIEKEKKNIKFPYKFSNAKEGDLEIIGFSSQFYGCPEIQPTNFIISQRDKNKLQELLNRKLDQETKKEYLNLKGDIIAYLLQQKICTK